MFTTTSRLSPFAARTSTNAMRTTSAHFSPFSPLTSVTSRTLQLNSPQLSRAYSSPIKKATLGPVSPKAPTTVQDDLAAKRQALAMYRQQLAERKSQGGDQPEIPTLEVQVEHFQKQVQKALELEKGN